MCNVGCNKDFGQMYGLGTHVYRYCEGGPELIDYSATNYIILWLILPTLTRIIKAVVSKIFAQIMLGILKKRRECDIPLTSIVGDMMGLIHNILFTSNYLNSSHLDVNNDGYLLGIWKENGLKNNKDWTFVFPHVKVKNGEQLHCRLSV